MVTSTSRLQLASIDRVLLAVNGGADELMEIRVRCSLGSGVVVRSTAKLIEEKLIMRLGVGRDTTYRITDIGRASACWLRKGGTRRGPKVLQD